jgi:hypothetical protein
MERPLLRLALLALPVLLGLSSLAAIIVAPLAWGAGDHAGLSSWMPPATALGFGLPGLFIADQLIRRIRNKTAGGFDLSATLLFYGLLAMPVSIAVLVTIAAGVSDTGTYDQLRGNDDDDLSPTAYLAVTLGVSALLNAMVAAASATYLSAISEHRRGPHDRMDGEVDGVGQLLSRRNQVL